MLKKTLGIAFGDLNQMKSRSKMVHKAMKNLNQPFDDLAND